MKIFFLLCCIFVSLLVSQPVEHAIHAVRTAVPPVIDGYGSDAVWNLAETESSFIQEEPLEGTAPSEKTEFKILYDDNNIYVFAMMYDSSPDSIVARLSRRDDIPESDYLIVGFDSYHDRQTAFLFYAMASGSKVDDLTYNNGNDDDYSWDPVWELKTRMLPNGWSAEMKIPLSQIRFVEGNDRWGINLRRHISRRQENDDWSLVSKKIDGVVSQFGTMTGMAGISLPKLLEVLPYAVASSEHSPQTTVREKVETFRPNAGVDIKYGVSSNFTLDATFNPDFAQVEADPAVLNLTTIETFYPEKRPFFIEGTQIVRFVTFGGNFGPGLFYSRRIGKAIDVSLPDDGVRITTEPHNATILGAAKLSGKTEGGTSIGVLSALTDKEDFTYRDTTGVLRTLEAEPLTSYNLFRVKQDFGGTSNAGAIVTATAADGKDPAYTAGTDWDIKLNSNTYRINGFLAHSRARAFNGEYSEGNAGKINMGRVSGNWVYSLGGDFTSRRYYIDDIGFFRSPNDYGVGGNVTYRDFTPGEYFQSFSINLNPHLRWNYDRLTLFRQTTLNASGTLLNYWNIQGGIQYSLGEKDPYDPRGYGAYNYPSNYTVNVGVETDNREKIIVDANDNFQRYADGGVVNKVDGSVTLRPTSSMEYEVEVGYATDRNFARYADVVTDNSIVFSPANPVAVYGRRNVDNVDLTLRSSVLFTQNISLQWYSQFFWAQGRYNDFSVLQPDGNLAPYAYTGNADFNTTALLSNVVLRWEYREGSTFYFVWSHGRELFQNVGYANGIADNFNNTFRVPPDNTYAVKISYWLSL